MSSLTTTEKLIAEVIRLFPEYLKDPVDWEMSKGNAAFVAIEPDGGIRGHLFGDNNDKRRWVFDIANRKALQVWSTGYATGDFEERVWSGKLDEGAFGINRPDFIGWLGGVPLLTPDGKLVAAAFSGIRGIYDREIVERAGEAAGLTVKRP